MTTADELLENQIRKNHDLLDRYKASARARGQARCKSCGRFIKVIGCHICFNGDYVASDGLVDRSLAEIRAIRQRRPRNVELISASLIAIGILALSLIGAVAYAPASYCFAWQAEAEFVQYPTGGQIQVTQQVCK